MPKYLYKKFPYVPLIKEHTELVRILRSGNKKQINKLLREQTKELKEYKAEYAAKKRR